MNVLHNYLHNYAFVAFWCIGVNSAFMVTSTSALMWRVARVSGRGVRVGDVIVELYASQQLQRCRTELVTVSRAVSTVRL